MRRPDADPTPAQLRYIDVLGGSWRDVVEETRASVSHLIEILKLDDEVARSFKVPVHLPHTDDAWEAFPKAAQWMNGDLPSYWGSPDTWAEFKAGRWREPIPPSSTSTYPEARVAEVVTKSASKLTTMAPLMSRVPDGYYAVDLGDGSAIKFLRVSTEKKGPKTGSRRVQTIHGGSLSDYKWRLYPSGKIDCWDTRIEDLILLLIGDYEGALRRYAREIDRCCRCNTRLTDERSRRFGIGPECEKHWPWIVETVLMEEEEKGIIH
jgi:hypothetical protein